MYKEWIKISDTEYTLQFKPNGKVELQLTVERDFEGDWLLSCFDLDKLDELIADKRIAIDVVKNVAEEYVRDYYREVGGHYLELLRLFDQAEEEDVTIDDAIFCAKVLANIECCEECKFYHRGDIWCRDVARLMVETLEAAKGERNE